MLFKIIELLKLIVEVASTNASAISQLLSFFWQCLETIASVLWFCLPESLAGVLLTSIGILIVLKIIQFH